jgi:lipopolysaccharide export system protein LptA
MKPVQEATQITVTCDGPLEVEYQKNVAIFKNNVKADKGDSVIYCDVLELYFSKNENAPAASAPAGSSEAALMANRLDRIVAHGNVRIERGPNVSYCQQATYTQADQKITLTGSPKLVLYSTQDMKGSLLGQ